tara:strand:+ start:678 stop:890 length:213 start_codon:yes stop_codon:yes gene_type:complete
MIPKEYIEYFEDYLADALNREVFDLAGSFTFPDGEEFPIVQLIIAYAVEHHKDRRLVTAQAKEKRDDLDS